VIIVAAINSDSGTSSAVRSPSPMSSRSARSTLAPMSVCSSCLIGIVSARRSGLGLCYSTVLRRENTFLAVAGLAIHAGHTRISYGQGSTLSHRDCPTLSASVRRIAPAITGTRHPGSRNRANGVGFRNNCTE
jgi:hypothetical protein